MVNTPTLLMLRLSFVAALAGAASAAPAPAAVPSHQTNQTNECNPAKKCNVCAGCCKSYIQDGADCNACVAQECRPAPPAANHTLFFKYVNLFARRCGDVDAAPRVPAAIFEPANAAALRAYETATVEFYHVSGSQLQLGACSASGYTKAAGTAPGTPWTSIGLMATECDLKCSCTYPSCPDVPDDPASGHVS